eukprot:CAMPEP_0185850962 /NCGR_PEP_ID=MMETSP1354-20130828/4886_1 /TAXON_ID=708628 /ORGANISM="Erythrolobus madagascarensis, Strain CCMP3276" /LENGTH=304 /DNA_ID=CAMNT_0028551695 /DNA_START=525 /DNA_END=1439 /DNA_ORIENTATION=-
MPKVVVLALGFAMVAAASPPLVLQHSSVRTHKSCAANDEFAEDNYDACPVHDSNYDISTSCNSVKDDPSTTITVDCTKLTTNCVSGSGCCDYVAALFDGTSVSTADAEEFLSKVVPLCKTTKWDAGAASDANHISVSVGEGDHSPEHAHCASAYTGSTTLGEECLSERSFKVGLFLMANTLVDTVSKIELFDWMTDILADARDSDRSTDRKLCLDSDDAKEAGEAIAIIIDTYASEQATKILAQEDICCHPMCYNLLNSGWGVSYVTALGSASDSFELIARKCCDVLRVTDPTCPATSSMMVGY